ncbi:MAG TPA: hypothetical protein VF765_08465 [Polyangiaceae bacterium]
MQTVRAAAALLAATVACGSSSGGSAAPCAVDAGATFDVSVDTALVDTGVDAGLVCEGGSIPSMGQCMNVAGSLAGLRWELPCTMAGGTFCPTIVDGGDVQVVSATLGGAPGQTYAVTLRFRGVVEMKTYLDGDAGEPQNVGARGLANAQFFVSGGVPSGNDSYNVYELQVSDPPGVYFMNSGVSNVANTWWLDYTATIAMKMGATVTMTADAIDKSQVSNLNGVDGGPVIVPGVPPFPQAYDGQFIQMDVVSVVEMP